MRSSLVISLAAERVSRGEPDLFPPPYLSDDLAIPIMRGIYEVERPSRLRRGASRLTIALAGLWCLSLMAIASAVVLILAGLIVGLGALSAMGAGR